MAEAALELLGLKQRQVRRVGLDEIDIAFAVVVLPVHMGDDLAAVGCVSVRVLMGPVAMGSDDCGEGTIDSVVGVPNLPGPARTSTSR